MQTTLPTVTAREFFSDLYKCTMYMADGPDATSVSLLARLTPESAIAAGVAYMLETRKLVGGRWVLKGVADY